MKPKRWLFIVLFILGISALSGCCPTLPGRLFDEPIPDSEIVFAAPDATGFMHPDGSGLILLDGGLPWSQWAGKRGDYLLWRGPYEMIFSAQGNDLFVKECCHFYVGDRSAIPGTDDLIAVLVEDEKIKLVRINFRRCKKKTEYRDLPNMQVILGTNPVHGDDIIYVQNYLSGYENTYSEEKTQLILFNTKTREQHVIKERIITNSAIQSDFRAPAFSPDGQWIAYTDEDGIHLIRPDGEDDHLLIKARGWYEDGLFTWPPAASFSPDGGEMVFHRCPIGGCDAYWSIRPGTIYRVDLQTGDETLLFDGGGNPFWRLTPTGETD